MAAAAVAAAVAAAAATAAVMTAVVAASLTRRQHLHLSRRRRTSTLYTQQTTVLASHCFTVALRVATARAVAALCARQTRAVRRDVEVAALRAASAGAALAAVAAERAVRGGGSRERLGDPPLPLHWPPGGGARLSGRRAHSGGGCHRHRVCAGALPFARPWRTPWWGYAQPGVRRCSWRDGAPLCPLSRLARSAGCARRGNRLAGATLPAAAAVATRSEKCTPSPPLSPCPVVRSPPPPRRCCQTWRERAPGAVRLERVHA